VLPVDNSVHSRQAVDYAVKVLAFIPEINYVLFHGLAAIRRKLDLSEDLQFLTLPARAMGFLCLVCTSIQFSLFESAAGIGCS
jgi:hypothetical protein